MTMTKKSYVVCGHQSQWQYLCKEKLDLKNEKEFPPMLFTEKSIRNLHPEEVQELIFYGTWWGNPLIGEPEFQRLREECPTRLVV